MFEIQYSFCSQNCGDQEILMTKNYKSLSLQTKHHKFKNFIYTKTKLHSLVFISSLNILGINLKYYNWVQSAKSRWQSHREQGMETNHKNINEKAQKFINKYSNVHQASTNAGDEAVSHLIKANLPCLIQLHIGDNNLRESVSLITKGNFKQLAFISINPDQDTIKTTRSTFFAYQELFKCDWKEIMIIFLAAFNVDAPYLKQEVIRLASQKFKPDQCEIQFR